MYTKEDYILFIAAICAFVCGLALLELLISIQERWAASRNTRRPRSPGRRKDPRRQHKSSFDGINKVLAALEGRRED